VAVLVLLVMPRASVVQPVAFKHLKHTKDLGLQCAFCHPYVTTGRHAGLPDGETCAQCHRAPQGTSAETVRLAALITEGIPVRFTKLFRLPDHVYYSHRRHVGLGQVECPSCHGAIAETLRPPGRPLVRITMEVCLDCHRLKGQSLDCVACHR
jgi:hypothetical protein